MKASSQCQETRLDERGLARLVQLGRGGIDAGGNRLRQRLYNGAQPLIRASVGRVKKLPRVVQQRACIVQQRARSGRPSSMLPHGACAYSYTHKVLAPMTGCGVSK